MQRSQVWLWMALHTLGAAGTYVFSKFAAVGFPDALSLTLARAVCAAGVLSLLAVFVLPKPVFTRSEWCKLAGLGLLLIAGNQYLFLRGMRGAPTGHPALLYAATPGIVLSLNTAFSRRWPPRLKTVGVLTALAGVLVLFQPWNQDHVAREIRTGDLWLLAAVLAWALYTIAAGPLCRRRGTANVTAWSLILGGLLFLPFAGPTLVRVEFAAVPTTAWIGLGWMVAVTSVFMMFIWNYLLRFLLPVEVSICTNAQPVATILLTVCLSSLGILTGEQDLTLRFVFGMVLILLGITAVQWRIGIRGASSKNATTASIQIPPPE